MTEYTVVAPDLELPRGARFTYKPTLPLEANTLYFISISGKMTIGRYYQDIAGCDLIIQPGQLIRVASPVDVEIWGLVVPLVL